MGGGGSRRCKEGYMLCERGLVMLSALGIVTVLVDPYPFPPTHDSQVHP